MAGKIIMWIVTFGCGILFYSIGAYAQRKEKPMNFWSGVEVDPAEITDIERYNRENGTMWKLYSLWYVAAGLAEFWNTIIAAALLVLGCTLGIGILIATYNRIYEKYKVQ